MKKIFSIFTVCAAMVVAASSMTSCKTVEGVIWNVEAQAAGEGKIVVEYPTGNPGLVVEGKATAVASTTNDSTAKFKGFAVPNGGTLATAVLENPSKYSKQEVKDAEMLVSEASSAVKFHAEGNWKASVTGYAKYGQLYFVINEHWPVDTASVK